MKISFNVNGGIPIEDIIITNKKNIRSLPVPTKQEYSFDGWFLNDELVVLPFVVDSNNINLEAHWKPIIRQAVYDIELLFLFKKRKDILVLGHTLYSR